MHRLSPSTNSLMVCRHINLSTATSEQLDELQHACTAATFGRGDENVLDESYRKAGKLDVTQFSMNLNPERAGLVRAIQPRLLGSKESRSMRLELYKLSVYGESFTLIY